MRAGDEGGGPGGGRDARPTKKLVGTVRLAPHVCEPPQAPKDCQGRERKGGSEEGDGEAEEVVD